MEYKISIPTVNTVSIETLKKGDYFKLADPRLTRIYVYDGYNRHSRKYDYYRFDDVNHFRNTNKGTQVVIDFDF